MNTQTFVGMEYEKANIGDYVWSDHPEFVGSIGRIMQKEARMIQVLWISEISTFTSAWCLAGFVALADETRLKQHAKQIENLPLHVKVRFVTPPEPATKTFEDTKNEMDLRGVDRVGSPREAWCQFLTNPHRNDPHKAPRFMHCNEIPNVEHLKKLGMHDPNLPQRGNEFIGAIRNGTWAEVPVRETVRALNNFAHARNIFELLHASIMAFGHLLPFNEETLEEMRGYLEAKRELNPNAPPTAPFDKQAAFERGKEHFHNPGST